MFFLWINEKDNFFSIPRTLMVSVRVLGIDNFFSIPRTLTLTISFFEKQNLERYSRSAEMSRCDKLILGVCLLHPVFLSDMLSDTIGVISKYSVECRWCSIQLPKQFCLGLLHVSFLRQKIWDIFYDPPGISYTLLSVSRGHSESFHF